MKSELNLTQHAHPDVFLFRISEADRHDAEGRLVWNGVGSAVNNEVGSVGNGADEPLGLAERK